MSAVITGAACWHRAANRGGGATRDQLIDATTLIPAIAAPHWRTINVPYLKADGVLRQLLGFIEIFSVAFSVLLVLYFLVVILRYLLIVVFLKYLPKVDN